MRVNKKNNRKYDIPKHFFLNYYNDEKISEKLSI